MGRVWLMCVGCVKVLCVGLLVFGSGVLGCVWVVFWFLGVGASSSMGVGDLLRPVQGE